MSLDTYAQLYSQQPHLGDCLLGVGGNIQLLEHYLPDSFNPSSATPRELYRLSVNLNKAIATLGRQLNALRFPKPDNNFNKDTITSALEQGKRYHHMMVSWFADFQPALIGYAKYGSDSSKESVVEKFGELQQQHVLGGLGFVIKVLFDSRVHFSSPAEWAAYKSEVDSPTVHVRSGDPPN
ncbi:MAG: hypothetical protein Q7R76_03130 [Candidatus Woesearchaeota archaeon]|nr:hypothetical protein [Candidatus Woesearchaeota archaeon]